MPSGPARPLLSRIGPGLLVAATGVGAGDLATAGLVGAELGAAVAWAVVLGAVLKLVLTENLARHQLATGRTVLESASSHLGWVVWWPFGAYLIAWSYFVGAALVSANATAISAVIAPDAGPWMRFGLGAGASGVGVALAWFGGFRLFERVMAACVVVMVVVVLFAAALTRPDPIELVTGLAVPTIPDAGRGGLAWTVALMGGVGGTLTIICYGYWMRESGRTDAGELGATRLDVALGYAVTALFGVGMLVIAAPLGPQGSGLQLVLNIADAMRVRFSEAYPAWVGGLAWWAFTLGAIGAVFSSLLGVWQAVPSVFADWWRNRGAGRSGAASTGPVDRRSLAYRGYLIVLAVMPLGAPFLEFAAVQRVYAIVGAAFVPGLAVVLLVLNNRPSLVPRGLRNAWLSNALLVLTLVLTVALAVAGRVLPG